MADEEEHEHAKPMYSEKLRLVKSPVIEENERDEAITPPMHGDLPDLSQMGDRPGLLRDMPVFKRHEDASLLELFFDLFFAANYTVFSQTQAVTSRERFEAYVGYFCVLWITWFLVGLYDVRFVTDSFFERASRGVHLGVMVGLAVVAPNFDPSDQNMRTMRTMSLILMVSRLCLAVEYGSILWHVRKFKRARTPLYVQISINVVAALVYMGITFRFRDHNSRVFWTWYVAALLEAGLTILISNFWEVLSLTKTHLMKRMSLLTVIIIGDGIVVVGQDVVKIVDTPDAWNPTVIGIVTAATATIYFVFLVYFDWMRYSHLPPWRQQIWTILHFPFHLSMVVFMQGFTQFIIWSKAVDVIENLRFDSLLNSVDAMRDATSAEVQKNLTAVTNDFFLRYPIKYYETWESLNWALANITDLPNDFWPQMAEYSITLADKDMPPVKELNLAGQIINTVGATMSNSLFEALGIDLHEELLEENPSGGDVVGGGFQASVNYELWDRYKLMFALGYIAAGITLMLMTILTIVSRIRPWRPWPFARTVLNGLLALGMGLVSTLYYHEVNLSKFLYSPWLLPTLCLTWMIVLVMTHVHNTPSPLSLSQNAKAFFNWPKVYTAVGERNGTRQGADGYETRRDTFASDVELTRPHHRDSFYGQVGFDGTGYGGMGRQESWDSYGLALHPASTAYEPYRQPQ